MRFSFWGTMMDVVVLLTIQISWIFVEATLSDVKDHPCWRSCSGQQKPMECHYHFTVEDYSSMSKACYNCPFNRTDCYRPHCVSINGVRRRILVVNRELPGPSIQVCHNDIIVVDVENRAATLSAVIHWHGITQEGTPYMDGTPMVTQCPILPATTFRYTFKAKEAGTFFWHGHIGMERGDGLLGSLVVRSDIKAEPNRNLYDFDLPEHVMLINDWNTEASEDRLVLFHHNGIFPDPQSLLINGRGSFIEYSTPNDTTKTYTPLEEFQVQQGKRYRFRIIFSGFSSCPVLFSVDGHPLTIIATDGSPVEPLTVDSLVLLSGERYDVIINASKEISSYWMRYRALMNCVMAPVPAIQRAVLRYDGAPPGNPAGDGLTPAEPGRVFDPVDSLNTMVLPLQTFRSLNSSFPDDVNLLKPVADVQLYLPFKFNLINNVLFNHPIFYPIEAMPPNLVLALPLIDHISLLPPPSPLLSQWDSVPKELICNPRTIQKNCSVEFCRCVHIEKVKLNSIVELVLLDEGGIVDLDHPMHLHGTSFRVVSMDKVGTTTSIEEFKKLDKQNKIPRKLKRPVQKDTVAVPSGGYTMVRFHAKNPGIWMLHCHIEFHMEVGMSVLIQVGERHSFEPVPEKFPQCGDWIPPVKSAQKPLVDSFVDWITSLFSS